MVQFPFPFPASPGGETAWPNAMPPATELQRVVDEDDDGPRGAASSSSGARGAGGVRGGWDWNKICAYHTNRVVRIQDANLGALVFLI